MLAIRTARRLGLDPVFLTNRPERYGGLGEAAPEVIVCETNEPAELSAVLRRLGRDRLAGVTTTSEFYLGAVAELAERFGLPGNSPRAVGRCRNKARVRQVLDAAGLSTVRFAVVREPGDLGRALRVTGLPCVVKPVDDSGSQNVRVCGTAEEAATQVAVVLAVRANVRGQASAGLALVEEYVPGPEFSVELFGGSLVGVTEKAVTPAQCLEWRHVYPADVDHRKAVAVAGRALESVGVRYGPSHVEVKIADGRVEIIEINNRLAGGMIPELIRLVDGVDLLEAQLRYAAGLPAREAVVTSDRPGYAGIQFLTAGRAGVVEEIAGAGEARRMPGVAQVSVTGRPGMTAGEPRSAYDRLGFVIATGVSRAQVLDRLAAAAGRITVRSRAVSSPAPGRPILEGAAPPLGTLCSP